MSMKLDSVCKVCAEEVEPHCATVCNSCGETFHLNQRQDLPGKDCGDVWLNEEHLGLEFACNICLAPAEEAADLDEVLDLSEAAAIAGVTEGDLRERAEGGGIRHRKTASGTYLFVRRDILER